MNISYRVLWGIYTLAIGIVTGYNLGVLCVWLARVIGG